MHAHVHAHMHAHVYTYTLVSVFVRAHSNTWQVFANGEGYTNRVSGRGQLKKGKKDMGHPAPSDEST